MFSRAIGRKVIFHGWKKATLLALSLRKRHSGSLSSTVSPSLPLSPQALSPLLEES